MAEKLRSAGTVTRGLTVSEAFAAVLEDNFARLTDWEAVAREGRDPEGVHQVRVAFRRLRSACRTFRPAVPKPVTLHWNRTMQAFAGRLGPARDLDVFVAELLEPLAGRLPLPGEAAFGAAVAAARAAAYADARTMLDGDDYAAFRVAFPVWIAARHWECATLEPAMRARLGRPITHFAGELLGRQSARTTEVGGAADPADAAAMHRLRIECKRLRYLAEFFSGLYDDAAPFVAALKRLQDLLGTMHDCAVTAALVERVTGDSRNPELLRYAGGLVGWRAREYDALGERFAPAWSVFVAVRAPWGG